VGAKKGKGIPYSITERSGADPGSLSQPAGDVSHKPGGIGSALNFGQLAFEMCLQLTDKQTNRQTSSSQYFAETYTNGPAIAFP